jgi:hypothetical protein
VGNRILVVDDEADQVELLAFNLRRRGYAIATALNGVEALSQVRQLAPDLILLDWMMPELDGLEVCQILRRDSVTAALPIIMLTAVASDFGRLTGLASGASAYMTKPCNLVQLVARIDELLAPPRE